MTLADLYNPKEIIGFLHKNGDYYEAGEDQQFQIYPGSIELWQTVGEGRILRVKRWLMKSVIATYRKEKP
jgi:hypothetical protein